MFLTNKEGKKDESLGYVCKIAWNIAFVSGVPDCRLGLGGDWPEYISEVKLVGCSDKDQAAELVENPTNGWKIIKKDLNSGAGGDYIYLLYKTSSSANLINGGYVTDFYIKSEGLSTEHPKSLSYGGHTYVPVPVENCGSNNDTFVAENGNLNNRTAEKGYTIYLYYTKGNFDNHSVVSSISFDGSDSGAEPWNKGTTSGDLGGAADLNDESRGQYIYMHVSKTKKTARPLTEPTLKTNLVYNGTPQSLLENAGSTVSGDSMLYYVHSPDGKTIGPMVADSVQGTISGTYYVGYRVIGPYSDTSSMQELNTYIDKASKADVVCNAVMYGESLQPKLNNDMDCGVVRYFYSTSQSGTYTEMTSSPKASGDYYIKAYVYPNGNCYTFSTSETKCTIQKKPLSHSDIKVSLDASNFTYNGNSIMPNVTVKDNSTDITELCDFTYANNTDAGTATVTIKAKESSKNYTGETTVTFEIAPKPLSSDGITVSVASDNLIYSGVEQTPNVTVKDTSTNITELCDFTYANNTDAGTATVTIKAKESSNYTGETTVTFEIAPKPLSSDGITVSVEWFQIISGFDASIVVIDGYKQLENKDYDVKIEQGNLVIATITGKGNYKDFVVKTAVPYIDEKGETKYCKNFTVLNSSSERQRLSDGWYVALNEVNIAGISLSGNANIILADGAVLTVDATNNANGNLQGIIANSHNITIYGQNGQSGSLEAKGKNKGIDMGNEGSIAINGGKVTAAGAYYGIVGSAGNITINGGTVKATGIGTIYVIGDIAISGGSVDAAYIKGKNISITGGEVTATTKGIYAADGNITLGWTDAANDHITASSFSSDNGSVKIADGKAFKDDAGKTYAGTLDADQIAAIAGKKLTPLSSVPYIDENGKAQICENFTVLNSSSERQRLSGGWYVALNKVNIAGIDFTGYDDVNIILADDAVLTVDATKNANNDFGINANKDIIIYGQEKQSGSLEANGKNYDIYMDNADIIINGGKVTAAGATNGIYTNPYSLSSSSTCNICINGGSVEAASISGKNISITGGEVTATTEVYAENGDITLGWTDAANFIMASRYSSKHSVKIADGKAFKDDAGNVYSGTLDADQIAAIAGKKLTPAIPYIDENGETKYCKNFTMLTSNESARTELSGGWYVALDKVDMAGIDFTGDDDVNIILADGAKLTVDGSIEGDGIFANKNIAIYGQSNSDQAGKLDVSGKHAMTTTSRGSITINGGAIIATGDEEGFCSKDITVNGGTVTAEGGEHGILTYSDITLGWTDAANSITASSYSSKHSVKIANGKAFKDEFGNIYIGTLNGDQIAAIAGKTLKPTEKVLGGDVSVTATWFQSGSGYDATIVVTDGKNTLVENKDYKVATSVGEKHFVKTVTGIGDYSGAVAKAAVLYIDENGETQLAADVAVLTNNENGITNLAGGWYVALSSVNMAGIRFLGDANLILADGAELNVKGGGRIAFESVGDIAIYGQVGQNGVLVADGVSDGISVDGNLTINGGSVTARAQENALGTTGIGAVGNLTINGGSVSATGGSYGLTVIGNMAINSGTVAANGIKHDGLIVGGNLTINGGSVSAIRRNNDEEDSGLKVKGDITLGWTNAANDRIKATSYHSIDGSLKIADGKKFKDDAGNVYSGTLTSEQIAAIAGKTLTPIGENVLGVDVTVTATWFQSGSGYDATIVVMNGTTELQRGTDYEVKTSGDKTRIVKTVTGMGDYSGTVVKTAVPYIDENGETQFATDVTVLTSKTNGRTNLASGWYVALSSVNMAGIDCDDSDANIILADGAELNVNGSDKGFWGLFCNIVIYGQKEQSGSLEVKGDKGLEITSSSSFTMNGGKVSATGVDGCGLESENLVTINGGVFIATGNQCGIDADITLDWMDAEKDSIKVSSYKAEGSVKIADGKAFKDDAGNVYSGTLTSEQIAAIAGKKLTPAFSLAFVTGDENIVIKPQTVAVGAKPTKPGNPARVGFKFLGWFADENSNDEFNWAEGLTANTTVYARWNELSKVSYLDENGKVQQITDYLLLTGEELANDGVFTKGGWYVVQDKEVTYDNGNFAFGSTNNFVDVNLIIADGASLIVRNSGPKFKNLTIYVQSTGINKGQIDIETSAYAAIEVNKNFVLNGGVVKATGGSYGIASFGNVTINGGSVTATATDAYSHGIYAYDNVLIDGSEVEATGTYDGIHSEKGNVTINGGSVTAKGTDNQGINAKNVLIDGSEVEATGDYYGINANSGDVTINGGSVTAKGTKSQGIFAIGNVLIDGSEVEATGLNYGINANSGDVTINGGSVTATATDAYSHGIYAKNVMIEGSKVEVTGVSYGIYANSGDVTINGGSITATATEAYSHGIYAKNVMIEGSKVEVAGVSYGIHAFPGDVTIKGGSITATATDDAYGEGIYAKNVMIEGCKVEVAGINYGIHASSGDVTIKGGSITAKGTRDEYGIGIGAGKDIILGWTDAANDLITANSYKVNYGGSIKIADGKTFKDGAGNGYSGTLTSEQIAAIAGKKLTPLSSVPYIDENGKVQICKNFTVLTSNTDGRTTLSDGWYVALNKVNIAGIDFTGDASIILADDAELTVDATNNANNNLQGIYANDHNIAIYGQNKQSGSLEAKGTDDGIKMGNEGSITINGGKVTAAGAYHGIWSYTGNITINGGTVKATGGGTIYVGGDIAISGGSVEAVSIFGNNISIKGGEVTATTDGILAYNDFTMSDGTVTATGSSSGIGAERNLVINGGTVSATGTHYGINVDGSITINGGSVTATGNWFMGIFANNDITLGWTDAANDRIKASSFYSDNGSVKIDKAFKDEYGEKYASSSDPLTSEQIDALAGKTLVPDAPTKSLASDDITIDAISDQEWEEFGVCPAIRITDGEKELAWNSDYKVKCSNNRTTGTATMTISGKGYYAGCIVKTFEIVPKIVVASGAAQVLQDQNGVRAVLDGEYKTDNKVVEITDVKVDSVVFKRTFTKGKHSTIMLPFSMNVNKVSGADFYQITDIKVKINDNGGKKDTIWGPVMITQVKEEIKANTPYLLGPTKTSLSFDIGKEEGVTLNTSEMKPYTFTKEGVQWEFRGTYHYFDFGKDSTQLIKKSYGFAAKDQDNGVGVGDFRWTSDQSSILPMRCYLVYNRLEDNENNNGNGDDGEPNDDGDGNAKPQMVKAKAPSRSIYSSIPETLEVQIVDEKGGRTVIGTLNTRSGELRLKPRPKHTYDLKGRRVNATRKAKGVYVER